MVNQVKIIRFSDFINEKKIFDIIYQEFIDTICEDTTAEDLVEKIESLNELTKKEQAKIAAAERRAKAEEMRRQRDKQWEREKTVNRWTARGAVAGGVAGAVAGGIATASHVNPTGPNPMAIKGGATLGMLAGGAAGGVGGAAVGHTINAVKAVKDRLKRLGKKKVTKEMVENIFQEEFKRYSPQ